MRPTSDMVRGAIFSMLESTAPDWSRVLDLYAGSGALGIEALSRGAEWADFVEQDKRCCQAIRDNLEHTGLADRARVWCLDVDRALPLLDQRYGIVLLDPPYADPSFPGKVEELAGSSLVGEGSIIVVEHSRRASLAPAYGRFHLVKTLRHGDTQVSVYQYGEG